MGYVPFTTRNILWFDVESERVKVATHCLFDEGFNDLPIETLPPNVQHLIRVSGGTRPMKDSTEINSKDLDFFTYPFAEKEVAVVNVPTSNTSETFGFDLADDELYHWVYVKDIQAKSCASKIFPSE